MAAGAVSAQTYPPGNGYPGEGNPQRRGAGIPIPSKAQKPSDSKQALPSYRGKLKQLDDKSITLTLPDDRELLFKRDGKTKFYKGGDEIKAPQFAAGDQLSIEGPVYGGGYMLAVNVYWERAAEGSAGAAKPGDGKDDSVHDAWKDAPPPAGQAPPPPPTAAPPAAKPDPDDPGPPSLRHGSPADINREHAAPVPEIPPTGPVNPAPQPNLGAPPVTFRDDDDAPIAQRRGDDLIRRATDAAMDFTESLPNYMCKENIARYRSETHTPNWEAIDIVAADVIYDNKVESYKNITVNGKTAKKSFEETGGTWSTGEFGSTLVSLFSPGTVTDFRYKKDSRAGGVMAKVYDYTVEHAN